MKLGILGTGMIVKDMLTMIHEVNVEKIVILGTPNTKEETEELVEKHNLDGAFYDYDELLASDIDTVYVALPNFLHYSFAKKALENGKHAIIEKPVTSNAAELRELIRIADEKKLMIFEAMNIHYLPTFLSMKKDLEKLGNIRIVNANYSQYSSRYNAFKEGTILPAFDYHKSGGALMDINIYNIHTILGLIGAPQAAKYYPNIEQNIDVSGILVYEYEKYKAVSIGAKDCQAPALLEIQGDKGVIKSDNSCNLLSSYTLTLYGEEPVEKNFDEGKHRMYYEFIEFNRMITEQDFASQRAMLQTSLDISEMMEKARLEAGIRFDADQILEQR